MDKNLLKGAAPVWVNIKATHNQILACRRHLTPPSNGAAANLVIPMEGDVAGNHVIDWKWI